MRNYISRKLFNKDLDDLPLSSAIFVELTFRKLFNKTLFFISAAALLVSLCIVTLYIAR